MKASSIWKSFINLIWEYFFLFCCKQVCVYIVTKKRLIQYTIINMYISSYLWNVSYVMCMCFVVVVLNMNYCNACRKWDVLVVAASVFVALLGGGDIIWLMPIGWNVQLQWNASCLHLTRYFSNTHYSRLFLLSLLICCFILSLFFDGFFCFC